MAYFVEATHMYTTRTYFLKAMIAKAFKLKVFLVAGGQNVFQVFIIQKCFDPSHTRGDCTILALRVEGLAKWTFVFVFGLISWEVKLHFLTFLFEKILIIGNNDALVAAQFYTGCIKKK